MFSSCRCRSTKNRRSSKCCFWTTMSTLPGCARRYLSDKRQSTLPIALKNPIQPPPVSLQTTAYPIMAASYLKHNSTYLPALSPLSPQFFNTLGANNRCPYKLSLCQASQSSMLLLCSLIITKLSTNNKLYTKFSSIIPNLQKYKFQVSRNTKLFSVLLLFNIITYNAVTHVSI